MAAPLFGDDWLDKDSTEHDEAYSQFQGAVSTARTCQDEGIRQVTLCLSFFTIGFGYRFWVSDWSFVDQVLC